jgi:hypothetical protein
VQELAETLNLKVLAVKVLMSASCYKYMQSFFSKTLLLYYEWGRETIYKNKKLREKIEGT